MSGYTIEIHGSSNDSNFVLASESGSIIENASATDLTPLTGRVNTLETSTLKGVFTMDSEFTQYQADYKIQYNFDIIDLPVNTTSGNIKLLPGTVGPTNDYFEYITYLPPSGLLETGGGKEINLPTVNLPLFEVTPEIRSQLNGKTLDHFTDNGVLGQWMEANGYSITLTSEQSYKLQYDYTNMPLWNAQDSFSNLQFSNPSLSTYLSPKMTLDRTKVVMLLDVSKNDLILYTGFFQRHTDFSGTPNTNGSAQNYWEQHNTWVFYERIIKKQEYSTLLNSIWDLETSMNSVETNLETTSNIGLLDGHFSLVINPLNTILFCDYFKLEDGVLKLRRYRPNANTTPSRIDMVWWLNTDNAKLEHEIPLIYVGKTSEGYEFTSEWNPNIHPIEISNTLALKMEKIVLNPETLKNHAYDKEWLIKKTTAGWNVEKPLYLANDANTTLWTGNDGVDVSFTVYAEQSVTIDGVTGPRYRVQGIPLFTRFALIKNSLDKFSHSLINNLNKDVNLRTTTLETSMNLVENNVIDISSCLGYYYSSVVPVSYHVHYDNSGALKYTLLFRGDSMGISAEDWVQMWNVPLMEDKSRLRTLRGGLALYMRDSGLPILGPTLPSVRGYENRTLAFSPNYNTIYLDNGLRLLYDGSSATIEQKQNLASQWYGVDSSDILIPMDTWVIDHGGMNVDMTKGVDISSANLLSLKSYNPAMNNVLPNIFRVEI